MHFGIDTDAYNKPGTNFAAAVAAGFRNNYVKLGGQNLQGNAPYEITSNGGYAGFVDKNRAAHADRTGHYWVTGGNPADAAHFVLDVLKWTDGDFLVIDNERLDWGRPWSDSECMTFWNILWADKSRGVSIHKNSFHYGSQLGLYGAMTFPQQWRNGVKAIVALYNGSETIPSAPNVPQSVIKGHQFTSVGTYPNSGGVFDMNVFTNDAFVGGSFKPVPVPVVPHNRDGSIKIDEDGNRGPQTIARWEEVFNEIPEDGIISTPKSALIGLDQKFLNSVVRSSDIKNLTGKPALDVDEEEGSNTIKVRQFWLYNKHCLAVFHRKPTLNDFDGILGHDTNLLHQVSLNAATARSKKY